ncbi:MAG TPA: serine hydrolase [Pyrinomonadaceae bacterium]|nr:serine hydrolase [Pyrinomonadaceae bacterium]
MSGSSKSSLSRRRFLSTTAKSAVATIAYTTLKSKGGEVFATTIETQGSGSATKFQPAFSRLDEYIVRHMADLGAPGMTLAVANRDGALRISTYGLADTKANARVTPDTLFQIGSISKSFVGLTLLQQREEGKIDLNKPIVEYLPWLKVSSQFAPITTHHLLSHTSGLPGAPLLLDALLAELWTTYAPGNRFLYSNTGYNILGFIIEAIEKRPFSETVGTRLLKPLGMSASYSAITNEIRRKSAIGYGPLNSDRPFPLKGTLAESPWIEMDMAAGSIASTPGDMARYIRMLLNRGALPKGRILSDESFNLFIKPAVKSPFRGEDASYGYGLWVSEMESHTRLRHTGGMVAFSSSIDVDMTAGIGAFASVNASLRGYRPVAVTRYAIDLLNASLEGKPLPDAPASPPSPTEVRNAADYAGTYTTVNGNKLELVADGTKLLLIHRGERILLERSGGDSFIMKHPDFEIFQLGFVRDNQKGITEAYHGSNWYMGAKYDGPKSFSVPKEWEGYVGHYSNDSPWYGDIRVVLRKGQLYLNGSQRMTPRPDGRFGSADPEAPDRVGFESIIDGRAMRLNYSGILYRRTFTP